MERKVYDVLIAGGGVGGVSAAISARRENKKVLLIEKGSMLGGLATSGLINFYEPLCDGKRNQMIFSQGEELFKIAIKYGYNTLEEEQTRLATWFDHHLFALSLNELLINEGVDIMYETIVSDVDIDNGHINSIEITNVEGKSVITAKEYIDATGSAYLFRRAGAKVNIGKNFFRAFQKAGG